MRWGGPPPPWSWRLCEGSRSQNGPSCPPRSLSATPVAQARPNERDEIRVNPDLEPLIERMTLLEKIGQMTQVDVNSLLEGAVREFGIGSVLSGGGGNPSPNNPQAWADMVRRVQSEALESRLGIPLLYGVDAVHGHSNLRGATIFPHNVGLGATRDLDLVERIGRITASELLATNVHWTFAPAVSVPQDIRWGRTFEAYSEDPALVSSLGAAFIRGLNVELDRPVLASPKHFVGDGGTMWGSTRRYAWVQGWWNSAAPDRWQLDQGDLRGDEASLRSVHLRPYEHAIAAGALSIMISYSSWNGQKLHAHRYLLTDVLKGELGFGGFLVSDWLGVSQLDPSFERAVCLAINAGLDMVMVPFEYERFIRAVDGAVETGINRRSRIEDACRRILWVKAALGLFAHPFGDAALLPLVGSDGHRAVAREAVSKSQVLLKSASSALPLSGGMRKVFVAGAAADDLGLQCGGWTIECQGDRSDLALPADDVGLVRQVRGQCDVLVLVIYSGRPLIIGEVLESCDAIVASWLPGTEAQGIADVLFGKEPFTGRLPYAWPETMDQVRSSNGRAPLFPLSHGLSTSQDDRDRTHEH